jgi:hypothetical protein
LEHDQTDYGGHRVAAIKDLQEAESELKAARSFDKSHDAQGK